jgi:hypothetical protein
MWKRVQAGAGLANIGLADDGLPPVDAFGPMSNEAHRYLPRHAGALKLSNR